MQNYCLPTQLIAYICKHFQSEEGMIKFVAVLHGGYFGKTSS